MAIHDRSPPAPAPQSPLHARPPPPTPAGRGLFIKTVVPSGAVSHAVPCALLPPRALFRRVPSAAPAQLVVSTETSLTVFAADTVTSALVRLTSLPVYARVRALTVLPARASKRASAAAAGDEGVDAAASPPLTPGEVLVVLTTDSKVSFVRYDERTDRLVCAGSVNVRGPPIPALTPSPVPFMSPVGDHRLITVHPHRLLAAVATLESTVSVFPVLYLRGDVISAGKITSSPVDGTVLALDFLEDDCNSGDDGDAPMCQAVIIALVQKADRQYIALFTVGVVQSDAPGGAGGSLTLVPVGSMMTCASRYDDDAVARVQAKLTGKPVKPPPTASSLTRVHGCPYVFAVCLDGKLVVANARAVMQDAAGIADGSVGTRGGALRPSMAVRLHQTAPRPAVEENVDDDELRHWATGGAIVSQQQPHTSPSLSPPPPPPLPQISHHQTTVYTQTAPPPTQHSSLPLQPSPPQLQPPMPQLERDTPPGLADALGSGGSRNIDIAHNFLSYMYVPAHVSLDIGLESDRHHGMVTAFTSAKAHFSGDNEDVPARGGGIYFVTESENLFVLRWSGQRRQGVSSFVIPDARGRSSGSTDLAAVRASSEFFPELHFSVDFVGPVGPAVALAALDSNLLYVANDGADGSLRHVVVPNDTSPESSIDRSSALRRAASSRFHYKLPVRQEFLNMAPVSDFALVPASAPGATARANTLRDRGKVSPSRRRAKTPSLVGERPRSRDATRDNIEDSHHGLEGPQAEMAGERSDAHLVMCTGVGLHGSVRLVRAGTPVSVFSSSAPVFPSCNAMWTIRSTMAAIHDSFVVLAFAESTGVFLPAPPDATEVRTHTADMPDAPVARMLDASTASAFILDQRTITCGRVLDGVIAQVHRDGVRVVDLSKVSEMTYPLSEADGVVCGSVAHAVFDWSPCDRSAVSSGCVGAGYIVLSTMVTGEQPRLVLLALSYEDSSVSGLHVVSSVALESDVSCVSLLETADVDDRSIGIDSFSSHLREPNMVSATHSLILSTYTPSVEIRRLAPGLERVASTFISHWIPDLPRHHGSMNEQSIIRAANNAASIGMSGAVVESICSFYFGGRRMVVVGSRDGYVLQFALAHDASARHLDLVARRQIGLNPVRVSTVTVGSGNCVLAECERPWIANLASDTLSWTPLNFVETRAGCALSVPGAERCIAFVSARDRFHVCGIRRSSSVSVSTIPIESTPRRALPLDSAISFLAVATAASQPVTGKNKERSRPNISSAQRHSDETDRGIFAFLRRRVASRDESAAETSALAEERRPPCQANSNLIYHTDESDDEGKDASDPDVVVGSISDLRVYDCLSCEVVFRTSLLPGELVHVLLKWHDFVVVGTSFDLRQANAQGATMPERGRLLLYSTYSGNANESMSLLPCSEAILPGAVLAGAVSSDEEHLVVSANEHIFSFGLNKSGSTLVETARTSTRMLVTSISIYDGIVCATDCKDSLAFYRIDSIHRRLVRDRGDHRKRNVADAVQVDSRTAIATDKMGYLFSLAYDERDYMFLPTSGVGTAGTTASLAEASQSHQDVGSPSDEDGETSEDVDLEEMHNDGANLMHFVDGEDDDDVDEGEIESNQDTTETVVDDDHVATGDVHVGDDAADAANEVDGGGSDAISAGSVVIDNDGDDGGGSGVATAGGLGADDDNESDEDSNSESGNADAGAMSLDSSGQEGASDPEATHLPQPVQRNLRCDHMYNMNDIGLRLRVGSIGCHDRRTSYGNFLPPKGDIRNVSKESFWSMDAVNVITGTLSGAIIVGVPVESREMTVLREILDQLSSSRSAIGADLGRSYEQYRSVYGSKAIGCLDGDLLEQFCALDLDEQESIASAAGYPGSDNVFHVCSLIQKLCDRAH
jgi:Mono-functional DNA-alkylating methyl methanesulfonate N-term/CPSF A subunit region